MVSSFTGDFKVKNTGERRLQYKFGDFRVSMPTVLRAKLHLPLGTYTSIIVVEEKVETL